jgi:DNA mismatch repair ATPase MutS
VALVEQLEDARKAKGLPKHDVVRVFTPGTVVEEALLQENAQNHGVSSGLVTTARSTNEPAPKRTATGFLIMKPPSENEPASKT